jgi:hypothetical protein
MVAFVKSGSPGILRIGWPAANQPHGRNAAPPDSVCASTLAATPMRIDRLVLETDLQVMVIY